MSVLAASLCLLSAVAPASGHAAGRTLSDTSQPDAVTFISNTQQHCYERLVNDNNCCLDEKLASGANSTSIRRPGTEWSCTKQTDCQDSAAGDRGDDLLWTPSGANCSSPRILFIHGGSWYQGSPRTDGYDSLASRIAEMSGAIVMAIDYPLIPIGNYSSIMDWSLEAFEWLATHGPQGADCSSEPTPALLVGGDSSGGGSAASFSLRVQAERERYPPLAGVFLFSPWTNLVSDTPTYYYNAYSLSQKGGAKVYTGDIIFKDPPANNSKSYRANGVDYLGGNASMVDDPVASPFYAGEAEFETASAPMYIAVSGTEAIAGDSVVFATNAARSGIETHLEMFPGMWHDFPMYSEGCGSGSPLWQAELALNHTFDFVREISQRHSAGAGPAAGLVGGLEAGATPPLQVAFHYGQAPANGQPWIPAPPLRLLGSPPARRAEEAPPTLAEGAAPPGPRRLRDAAAVPPPRGADAAGALGIFAGGGLLGAAAVLLATGGPGRRWPAA